MEHLSEKILDATNGGLDIITHYYPEAKPKKHFKLRAEEKTASAAIHQKEGTWFVKDFGDGKSYNGISLVMFLERLEFLPACKHIVKILNIHESILTLKVEDNKAGFKKRPAKEDEEEGEYYFDIRSSFTEFELRNIYAVNVFKSKKTEELVANLKRFKCYSLVSFTYIKDKQALITMATDTYPIFLFDQGDFKKIYQPLSQDKQYKFRYVGTKPKRILNGLKQLREKYESSNAGQGSDENGKHIDAVKLKDAVLCSGEADSINIGALGYNPLWLNSESDILDSSYYSEVKGLVEIFYNLPDIDSTGIAQGHRLSLQYLDIHTIDLPQSLRQKKDRNGKPCKDVRDFLNHYSCKDLEVLISPRKAYPYRFWDAMPRYGKDNKFLHFSYEINLVHALYFLKKHGFYKLIIRRGEFEQKVFIKIVNNIVHSIADSSDIGSFLKDFLKERAEDIRLRNTLYKTSVLNDSIYNELESIEIDFEDFDPEEQFIFFKNTNWKITKEGIEAIKASKTDKYIWDFKVLQHEVELLPAPFKIRYNSPIDFDIEILNTDSDYFKFLINTCRMHWYKELEESFADKSVLEKEEYYQKNRWNIAGANLSAEEIEEQKAHLVNRIFTIGYLLHHYKVPSKPWQVWAMENVLIEESTSNGGSGKSVCMKGLQYVSNLLEKGARSIDIVKDQFIFEEVTENTKIILMDDAHEYIKFDFFFPLATGSMTINMKNKSKFTLPFSKSPKFVFTSNFAPKKIDGSTQRRLLYTVFSDFYHGITERYPVERSISDDIGKLLFNDFDSQDWNLFYNFMARCLEFYLTMNQKIQPPMGNISLRTLQAEMGADFMEWANEYFADESKLNNELPKREVYEHFIKYSRKDWHMNKFTSCLKAWCKFYHHTYNPKDLLGNQDRILKKHNNVTTEFIYIQEFGKPLREKLPF